MAQTKFKSVGLEYPAYEKLKELAAMERRSIGKQLAIFIEEIYEDRVTRKGRRAGISAALND